MSDTREKVETILLEALGIDRAELERKADLPIFVNHADTLPTEAVADSLGGDSLDWVEITMACEEQFDIEVSDEDATRPELNSIAGLTAFIDARLAAKA